VPTPGPAAAAPAAEPAAPAPAPQSDAPVPRPAATAAAAPADPGEATTAPGEPAAPAPIERQRADVAAAISTLPDVDRAFWSTESTLHVILNTIDGDAFTRICPLMERYDELASSRIQLTPPPDSGRNVRFRQCRNY